MSELRWAMYMSSDVDYEVQRTNQFSVIITGLPQEITLAVDNANIPNLSITPIELAHGNTKVKVAGAVSVAQLNLPVKDFILPDVEGIIYDWYNQVHEFETGKTGWAQHYKKSGVLYLFSPDGSVSRSWSLIGLWPSNVEWGDFTYDGGEKRQISMTLEVDRHYRNVRTGVPGNQGSSIVQAGQDQPT